MVGKGQEAGNILNASFHVVFNTGTGSGLTGALIIAIFLASRRDDYKAVSKVSLTPALFNINEPMIFGLPIVFNPILIIPFVLAPMASVSFGYIMTKLEIAKILYVMVPWTTPPILKSFLASGGHLPTVLVEIGAYIIAILIYIPFVKLANKEAEIID
ncbi:MAG: PTS sugar transporter subunit IIC [Erysipelothrix sp.]|nr:PTS sugar transporter subunit IIC [Erysipelothrix sp.]